MARDADESRGYKRGEFEELLFHLHLPRISREGVVRISKRISELAGVLIYPIHRALLIFRKSLFIYQRKQLLFQKKFKSGTPKKCCIGIRNSARLSSSKMVFFYFTVNSDHLRIIRSDFTLRKDDGILSNINGGKEETKEITAKNYEEIFAKLREEGLKMIKLAGKIKFTKK